jgi:hypothetical protein
MRKFLIAAVLFCALITRAEIVIRINYDLALKVNVSVQGAATTNSAGVVTYASPHKYSLTNAIFLKLLAAAENTNGTYTNKTFPSGSRLALEQDQAQYHFKVTDKYGNLIVDVSNIMTFGLVDDRSIQSGKVSPAALGSKLNRGVYTKLNRGYLAQIIFDDTKAGGVTSFYLFGLVTSQTMETPYVSTEPLPEPGILDEKVSGSLVSGTGDGSFGGESAVLTGSAMFSGKGILIPISGF